VPGGHRSLNVTLMKGVTEMGRLEELKSELAATVQYGRQIGDKLQNPDLGEADRMELRDELEATEAKADGLAIDVKAEKKTVERQLRINAIGRDMDVLEQRDEIVEPPSYSDPVEALLKSEDFARFAEQVKHGVRNPEIAAVEFKVGTSVENTRAGDKDGS